jgi:hypothetical protein
MDSKSVDAYKTSIDKNETLAMSNIANKFINAGFLKEADDICNRAIKIDDYHKNIDETRKRIKEIPEEESTKEKEALELAKQYSEFYRDYGRAVLTESLLDGVQHWKGPKCDLRVEIKGNQFLAEGVYAAPRLGLLSDFALIGHSGGNVKSDEKRRIRYNGVIRGRAIDGSKTDRDLNYDAQNQQRTILSASGEIGVLMVVSEMGDKITVYENTSDGKSEIYILSKVLEN